MNSIKDQLQQSLFVLLGVFIPTSIAISNFLIGGLVLCWIFEGNWLKKISQIKESKWILSIFGLIGLYVLGLFWGENHLNAKWQFQRLALLLVFPVFATMELKQKTIKRAVIAFLVTAFISAVIALAINSNVISPLGEYLSFINIPRNNSAFITYNYHNVILALAFSICIYILGEKKSKYWYLFLFFMLIYALSIFTESGRAGQVIFNFLCIFYILYYNRKHILRGLIFFLLLFSFQATIYKSTKVYKGRLNAGYEIIKNNGNRSGGNLQDIRYVFVKASLKKIYDKPILGYGTGSFGEILKNDTSLEKFIISWKKHYKEHPFDKHTTPHNQYLYVWFELGILGLFLLLFIFYNQMKELFRKKDGIHRVLLPLSFMFLMLVDSYFFIFILTVCYIFLFTIYSKYQVE